MINFNTPKLAKNNTSGTLDFSSTNIQSVKEVDILFSDPTPITIKPDSGFLGMGEVVVNHPPVEEVTEVVINKTGKQRITPSEGYDATQAVDVDVKIVGETKTVDITKNGTYTVNPSKPGNVLSQVTVNANVAPTFDINPGITPGLGTSLNSIKSFPGEYPVTSVAFWFKGNPRLTTIGAFNTSSVTTITDWVNGCSSLVSIAKLDFSNVVTGEYGSTWYGVTNLTTLGGFTGLKISVDLSSATKLTKESILNLFNEAATVTGKVLTLGSTNLAKLTDAEKAIATNKGWTLA